MKKLFSIAIILSVTFSGLHAQSIQEEIEFYQSIFGKGKETLIGDFLEIDKNDAFWSVYKEYEAERKELGQKRIKLLYDYAENYEDMNEDKTDEIVKQNIQLRNESDALISKYYKKIKKVSGTKKAAQFYQIENYFITAVRSELYLDVPLIGELD